MELVVERPESNSAYEVWEESIDVTDAVVTESIKDVSIDRNEGKELLLVPILLLCLILVGFQTL